MKMFASRQKKHSEESQNGSVTFIAIALCAIALTLAIGIAKIGAVTGTKGKAQNAADAASLSAAYDVSHYDPGKACTSARKAAKDNGAELIKCDTDGDEVEVEVQITINGRDVKAKARAYVN